MLSERTGKEGLPVLLQSATGGSSRGRYLSCLLMLRAFVQIFHLQFMDNYIHDRSFWGFVYLNLIYFLVYPCVNPIYTNRLKHSANNKRICNIFLTFKASWSTILPLINSTDKNLLMWFISFKYVSKVNIFIYTVASIWSWSENRHIQVKRVLLLFQSHHVKPIKLYSVDLYIY